MPTFDGTPVVGFGNILTVAQAANALRVDTADARMLDLLPQIDQFIWRATGRDWTQDVNIHPTAVSAATMLLVQWFDNPAMIGGDSTMMNFGLTAALTHLEVEALKYRKYEFTGLSGAGSISLPGARAGDTIIKLIGVYGSSGDQSAKFESAIVEDDLINQVAAEDLSDHIYVVVLKSPADDISA